MKHTAGYAKPRRMTAPTHKTRLNLQRRPAPEPDDQLDAGQKTQFWKWVFLVALFHVLAIVGLWLAFELMPANKPAEQFISLLPPGDSVKGTPGQAQAHKTGTPTPAAPSHQAPSPAPPAAPVPPKVVTPPPAVKAPPPPTIKEVAPAAAAVKPPPPKPAKPKVKVDLNLVDGPAEPVPKPAKHVPKKPPVKRTEETDKSDARSNPDSTGLTKEQIAEKLGEKANASGSKNALKSGVSGSPIGPRESLCIFLRDDRRADP